LFTADIDECSSPDLNKCHANATCTDTEGGYKCQCVCGFTDITFGDGTECSESDVDIASVSRGELWRSVGC